MSRTIVIEYAKALGLGVRDNTFWESARGAVRVDVLSRKRLVPLPRPRRLA